MESANFHLHQQEDHHQLHVDSSSFSWSQNPILNGPNNNISSIIQDFKFPCNGTGYPIENFMTQDLQSLARIKDEFSVVESYPKFLELLNCNPTSCIQDLHLNPYSTTYLKNEDDHQQISYSNNNQDLLLTNYSNGCQIKGGQLINDQNCSSGTFSQIFPSISISSLNQSTTTSSSSSSTSSSSISPSSFDMNCLPALDPFGSPRFDGKFSHHSSLSTQNLRGVSYGFDRMPNHRPTVYPSKISSVSTTGSTKRPASKYVDAKETKSVAPKKLKSEPRSSSTPFQVRKEKLGDRIAAIQQLVAPFGKTDTASVLLEAIGYIKFLQTQVETLSVPYLKSTNEIGGISQGGQVDDGHTGVKRDLRSRGLCLVPVSCLSYVTDGCEGIWPAP
ncbi:putative transcription factor bHLH family [Helianthus annuus]|nr:putative transcription factor bHLH family [Helianthus annuus]